MSVPLTQALGLHKMRHLVFLITSFAVYFSAIYYGYHYGDIKDIEHLLLIGVAGFASLSACFPAGVLNASFEWRANSLSFGVAGALSAIFGLLSYQFSKHVDIGFLVLVAPAAIGVVSLIGLTRLGATFIRQP